MAVKKKKLVIVESPAKIKKISSFLGSQYIVKACLGHIMDLPTKGLGIDIKNDFQATYQVIKGKKDVVRDLKAVAKKVDEIFLATDPDREAEFIAQCLVDVLNRKGIVFHRASFNAITKKDVLHAINNPTSMNQDLIEAQQARRSLDRLTGFKISPLLWRRGKDETKTSRSAGRVQSVGLKIIVDRHKEIEAFKPVKYWSIEALVSDKIDDFIVQLVQKNKLSINSQAMADKIVTTLKKHDFIVDKVDKKQENKKPYAPFTTSTLQQTCAGVFNWTSKRTMSVAQKLYEQGHITYMRTDSVKISDEAIKDIRTLIPTIATAKHLPAKSVKYKTKSKAAQEAHEAIRATDLTNPLSVVLSGVTGDEKKLLELIWRRTIASQMSPAVFDKVEIVVKAGQYKLKATGQTQTFDGFLNVWTYSTTKEVTLPVVKVGQKLDAKEIKSIEHETKPPPRYNNASLVKELEANGVGRPSTYASIIDTLLNRKYVEKDGKAFVPTDVGIEVSDFLSEHFENIININFTSRMEDDLDEVANGNKTRLELLEAFWKDLKSTIDEVRAKLSNAEIAKDPCPACGEKLFVRVNRKDKSRFFACSNKECKKTFDMDSNKKPVIRKVETLGTPCPECKGDLVKHTGKYGVFYGCENYKNGCKVTADKDGNIKIPPKSTGEKCKKCKKGELVIRKNKQTDQEFLACNRWPKCKFSRSIVEDEEE